MRAIDFVHLPEKDRTKYLSKLDEDSDEHESLLMDIEDLLREYVFSILDGYDPDEDDMEEEAEELTEIMEEMGAFDDSVAAILELEPTFKAGEKKSLSFLKKVLKKKRR